MTEYNNDRLLELSKKGVFKKFAPYSIGAEVLSLKSKSERLEFMSKINKDCFKRIYNDVKSGSSEAIHTVHLLYVTGFGLNYDEIKASRWARFSLFEGADISFEQALVELKKDIKESLALNSRADSLYPQFRTKLPLLLKNSLHCRSASINKVYNVLDSRTSVNLYPAYAGVKTTLVYKVSDTNECHIYDAFFESDSEQDCFVLDVITKLNIPSRFGDIRGRNTISNYPKRINKNKTFKYFAVRGTIVVPNSKKELLKEVFPDVKNTLDLAVKFMGSAEQKRQKFVDSTAEIAALEKNLLAIKKKSVNNNKIKNTQRVQYVKQLKALKEDYAETKREIEKLLESDVVNKEKLESSYPEYFLNFIASEVVGITEDYEVDALNLKPKDWSTHLSSLGFMSMYHPSFEAVSCCTVAELDETKIGSYIKSVRKLYKNEYNISGILIRPSSWVSTEKSSSRKRFFLSKNH